MWKDPTVEEIRVTWGRADAKSQCRHWTSVRSVGRALSRREAGCPSLYAAGGQSSSIGGRRAALCAFAPRPTSLHADGHNEHQPWSRVFLDTP
jgi:hypothetical protein